jgi:hypothetical protein
VSDKPSSWFAELYKRDQLTGGHVIMLGADEGSRWEWWCWQAASLGTTRHQHKQLLYGLGCVGMPKLCVHEQAAVPGCCCALRTHACPSFLAPPSAGKQP